MTTSTPTAPSDTDQSPAYRMATLLIGIGTMHLLAPKPFDAIVPVELPGSRRFYTYASGIAEVITGALLLSKSSRRFGTSIWCGCGGANRGRCG